MSPYPIRGVFIGDKVKNWQESVIEVDKLDKPEHKKQLKRVGGAVIFIDSQPDEDFAGVITTLGKVLKKESKIWVLERNDGTKLSKEEKDMRLALLESHGFVCRKVISVRQESFCLWLGRKEKIRKEVTIDLTTRPWFEPILKKAVDGYEYREGRRTNWRVVEVKEITERCQESHLPLEDYRSLSLGFGVKLEAPCGCQWQVSLDGTWMRLMNCPDKDCDGGKHFI